MSAQQEKKGKSVRTRKRRGKSMASKRMKSFVRYFAVFFAGVISCYLLMVWPDVRERVEVNSTEYRLPLKEAVIGIDISHHQGRIDWSRVEFSYEKGSGALVEGGAAGVRPVDFVIAKATEGLDHQDRRYAEYKAECERVGIPFGAYHYFKPGVPAGDQASNFIKSARLGTGNMIPVLDVEERGRKTVSELQTAVLGWLQTVENIYGVKPVVYCSLSFYEKYFRSPRFSDYRFWIAAYSRESLGMDYVLWQQTDRGRVRGIKEKTDIDVFNGSKADFRRTMLIR